MYEEYMQNFYNFPMNGYQNTYDYGYRNNVQTMTNAELEALYPEIYRIVYPMVKRVCKKNNRNLNKKTIDNMVDEVYSNVETNGVGLNITLNNDVKGEKSENTETTAENTQIKNNSLNDLIRILILRELQENLETYTRQNYYGMGQRQYFQRTNPWQYTPDPRYDFEDML